MEAFFNKKTKAKLVNGEIEYGLTAFHYIHQNPYEACLVERTEDWPFSSYTDFAGLYNESLCNIKSAIELFQLNTLALKTETHKKIEAHKLKYLL